MLVKLEEKIKRMLAGETRRREKALQYLQAVQDDLLPVAEDIWGEGNEWTVWVTRRNPKNPDNIVSTDFYFRYRKHSGETKIEREGLYLAKNNYAIPVWGTPIEDLRGKEFWYAVQVIVEWVGIVGNQVEKIEEGREKLLALLPVRE